MEADEGAGGGLQRRLQWLVTKDAGADLVWSGFGAEIALIGATQRCASQGERTPRAKEQKPCVVEDGHVSADAIGFA